MDLYLPIPHPLFVHHPISLRVNLDMGKTVYARQIMHDDEIQAHRPYIDAAGRARSHRVSPVRKTGTLTQNEMELRKLHMGTMSYGWDSMDEVASQLATALQHITANSSTSL